MWQKDSLAPELCAFNSEGENLPLEESNSETCCSMAHLQNGPASRGAEPAGCAGVVGGDTSCKGWWLLCCKVGSSSGSVMFHDTNNKGLCEAFV